MYKFCILILLLDVILIRNKIYELLWFSIDLFPLQICHLSVRTESNFSKALMCPTVLEQYSTCQQLDPLLWHEYFVHPKLHVFV